MFIETKEGQTHATCEEQLKKYGGKAKCCLCNVHEGCSIANSKGMFSPHDMTKAIKHAGKYMKKEQDKVLRKKHGHRYGELTNKCKCGKIRHSIACQMDGHKCYCDLTKPLYNL